MDATTTTTLPPQSTIHKEVTLKEANAAFLTNTALRDFYFVGTDGVKVPANRYLLSARSPVLQSLLLGSFREASNKSVEVGYEGSIMKAIVEYVSTDTTKLLQPCLSVNKKGKEDQIHADDVKDVQEMVRLIEAAEYFQLPRMAKLAEECLCLVLTHLPNLAFAALEAIRKAGPSISETLQIFVMRQVRIKGGKITAAAVECLSLEVLKEILQDPHTEKNEFELFTILQSWMNSDNSKPTTEQDNSDDFDEDDNKNDKQKVATELMKYIDLSKINPELLATTVAESGFVQREELYEAYKTQALAAVAKHSITYHTPREHGNLPVWKGSHTPVSKWKAQQTVDDIKWDYLLGVRPMKSGSYYQWTIEYTKLVDKSNWVTLAGVCPAQPYQIKGEPKAWTYDMGDGLRRWMEENGKLHQEERYEAFGEGKEDYDLEFPEMRSGQKVTFFLNLLANTEDEGALMAKVDGGEAFCLFNGMREIAESEGGLVPVVAHGFPVGLRLLGFQQWKRRAKPVRRTSASS